MDNNKWKHRYKQNVIEFNNIIVNCILLLLLRYVASLETWEFGELSFYRAFVRARYNETALNEVALTEVSVYKKYTRSGI